MYILPAIIGWPHGILDETLYNAPRTSKPFVNESKDSLPRELADARP